MGYGVAHAPPLLLLLLLMLWALSCHILPTASTVPATTLSLCFSNQSSALLRFKQGLMFDPAITTLSSWQSGTDCCKWEGVTCDDNLTGGFVTALEISGATVRDASGPFSTIGTSLFELRYLRTLDLSINGFKGSIPTRLAELTHLTDLYLSRCFFSGQIPAEMSQMTSLVNLDLGANDDLQLQHPTFPEFVKRLGLLQYLGLNDVNISMSGKDVSLAASSSLLNLRTLRLLNCSILGPMHESITRLRSLSSLDLGRNNLGYFPEFFSNFTSLKELFLNDAQLNGKFSWGILQLPQLQTLYLYGNPQLNMSLPPKRVLPESSKLMDLKLSLVKVLSASSLLEFTSKLTQLISLDLSACGLNGMIPSSWACQNILDIRLNNNSLSGPIPEALAKLSSLSYLDLRDNLLNGTIPAGLLYSHPSLDHLSLSNNRLKGSLSHFYGQFSKLSFLNLSSNLLSGEIPSSIGRLSNLEELDLSSNNMTGPIPTSICSCKRLIYLDLYNNSLTGTIPSCLPSLDMLIMLNLRKNQLQGSIPEGFTNRSSLNMLQLNDNLLVGKIPRSLSNCHNLQFLDLSNNELEDTFPSWLWHLTQLQVLVLHSNRLYGSIASSDFEGGFQLVQIFDIADNQFSGVLPSTLFKTFKAMVNNKRNELGIVDIYLLAGNLRIPLYTPSVMLTIKGESMVQLKIAGLISIDLSCNIFIGGIPEEIGTLTGIHALNMSHNNLKGPIPKSFGNLRQIESLDLSDNQLSGGIPREMINLTFLSILNLSFNNLQGSIPKGGQFNTFDDTCFEGNPQLCGTKSRPCPVSSVTDTPPIVGNKKIDHEPEWEYMAPGLGFALGLAAIVLPILFSKRMWNWYWDFVDKMVASLLPWGCFE